MKKTEGVSENGNNRMVSDEEWEKHGYKKIKDELPIIGKEIVFLGKRIDVYGGHRIEWIGKLVDANSVITNGGYQPLSNFTHWAEGKPKSY